MHKAKFRKMVVQDLSRLSEGHFA